MEEKACYTPLSPDVAKSARIRLAKIIGQLKSVAKMLSENPRNFEALTQYASANAAVGSLMNFVAKDIVITQIKNEVQDGAPEQCIYSLLSLLNELEEYEDYEEFEE